MGKTEYGGVKNGGFKMNHLKGFLGLSRIVKTSL